MPRSARHVLLLAALVAIVATFDLGISNLFPHAEKKYATDELTDDTFAAWNEENPVTAILFYAPWCFYSQQVMPAWDLASQKLMLHDPPIRLAKIDASKYRTVADTHQVNAFPTLKLFSEGVVFDYESHEGRSWQSIVKWVNKHTDRDHILKSVEDVDHYLHDNDLNVIGLFTDGHPNTVFGHSALHYEDVMFAESQGTDISTKVAEHLSRHATLVCETIDIGQSHNNTRSGALPRAKMHCSDTPRNPQRQEWSDRFHVEVVGQTATVQRSDSKDGWQQMLQLQCCDDEESAANKEKHKIPVPSIVMFMPHDERFAVYDGDLSDVHAIDKFVSSRRTPMVMRFDSNAAEKIFGSGGEKVPVLFLITQQEETAIETVLRDAVKKLRGRVLVVFSTFGSPIEKRLADVAGVEAEDTPVIQLIETHGGSGPTHTARKFRLPTKDLTAQAVETFISTYEKGTLKPFLKSEPEPSEEDLAGTDVGVLVGTTFTEVAHDDSTDVLVDFYAPWCGHCRKFEPDYKSLARKLRHVKTLKVMKFDATRNEAEGMSINGFPTIILFPAGKGKGELHYSGKRTPDDMVKWLGDHCTHKFNAVAPAEVEEDPVESGLLDPAEEDL